MHKVLKPCCNAQRFTCRYATRKANVRYCEILLDTNYDDWHCPFYKDRKEARDEAE